MARHDPARTRDFGDTMDITLWGPAAWHFLHAVSFRYPERAPSMQHRKAMFDLLTSLKRLLPCTHCRMHFEKYIDSSENAISSPASHALDSRDSISRWLVDLHNDVNRRLHKTTRTYADVAHEYRDLNKTCPHPDSIEDAIEELRDTLKDCSGEFDAPVAESRVTKGGAARLRTWAPLDSADTDPEIRTAQRAPWRSAAAALSIWLVFASAVVVCVAGWMAARRDRQHARAPPSLGAEGGAVSGPRPYRLVIVPT